jgi:demethylmenaquinone methyltransferase/2-methoxy-6-polyprenyl-1,4-benzoquinol methylase
VVTSTGSTGPNASTDEASASLAVREMFDAIAPRYDLLNQLLSANACRRWWSRVAKTFRETLAQPDARIIDLCCGTGSLTVELLRRRPPAAPPILAIDFSHAMLTRGRARFASSPPAPAALAIEADAMHLPIADSSIDLITTAFGFRNLPNYDLALIEMHRVLRPGGTFAILEANEPRSGLLSALYRFYFHRVVPAIGSAFSSGDAYRYLPSSVARFPPPDELIPRIRAAGFAHASWTPYTAGIAGLYTCRK